MRRGAIIVNAYWRGGDECAEMISDCLARRGVRAPLVRAYEVDLDYDNKGLFNPYPFEFAVFYDKDDYLARHLESRGVRLFNTAESIRLADDKMLTHLALEPHVRQPHTISSPLCFAGEDDPSFLKHVVDRLGFPVVVKKCYGAFGRQVFLAKNMEELKRLRAEFLKEPHLYQRYVDCGAMDIRVITIGGKAVCAMRRRATTPGEFRANAELGGVGEPLKLTPALVDIAEKASRALGLEYAGVDLLWDEDGYLVTEVNSNAHFKLIRSVTGVPVDELYADYIVSELEKGDNR